MDSWPEWVYNADPDMDSMEALITNRVRHRRARMEEGEEEEKQGRRSGHQKSKMLMDKPGAGETRVESGCEFPQTWSGEWFSKGERETFQINGTSLGLKGICFKKLKHPQQERYILYQKHEHCYKCLVVFNRHTNVLQVKEGLCTPPEKGPIETAPKQEKLCQLIAPGSPVQTLVRVDGENIDCPFTGGDFSFTYKTGQSVCNNPRSYLDACMTNEQLAFRFQACPDRQSDNRVETLTCMANWTEGNRKYLVGMLEEPYKVSLSDKIRCFIYHVDQKGDVHIGQSEEATCDGLRRVADGHRTIKMRNDKKRSEVNVPIIPGQIPRQGLGGNNAGNPGEPNNNPVVGDGTQGLPDDSSKPQCRFPSWAVRAKTFHNFGFTSQYNFTEDGVTMVVSNFSYLTNITHLTSKTICVDILEPGDISVLEAAEAEVKPERAREKREQFWETVDMVKMVAQVTAGCTTKFKCMTIYRRNEDIIEIQEGKLANDERSACMLHFMNEMFMSYTMLLKAELEYKPCTADGMHNVTSLELRRQTNACATEAGFHEVSIRCGDDDDSDVKIQFFRRCKGVERISEFFCMGGWEEEIPYSSLPPAEGGSGLSSSPASEFASGNGNFGNFYDSGTGYDMNSGRSGGGGGGGYGQGYNGNQPGGGQGQPLFGQTIEGDEDFGFDIPENITIGYMVARPKGQDPSIPKRVCFIYTYVNETYSWTVDINSCRRNIRPGHAGVFKFRSVKTVACGASKLYSFQGFITIVTVVILSISFMKNRLSD